MGEWTVPPKAVAVDSREMRGERPGWRQWCHSWSEGRVREHRAVGKKGRGGAPDLDSGAWVEGDISNQGGNTGGDGEFRLGSAEFEVPVYMQVEVPVDTTDLK